MLQSSEARIKEYANLLGQLENERDALRAELDAERLVSSKREEELNRLRAERLAASCSSMERRGSGARRPSSETERSLGTCSAGRAADPPGWLRSTEEELAAARRELARLAGDGPDKQVIGGGSGPHSGAVSVVGPLAAPPLLPPAASALPADITSQDVAVKETEEAADPREMVNEHIGMAGPTAGDDAVRNATENGGAEGVVVEVDDKQLVQSRAASSTLLEPLPAPVLRPTTSASPVQEMASGGNGSLAELCDEFRLSVRELVVVSQHPPSMSMIQADELLSGELDAASDVALETSSAVGASG